MSHGTPGAGGYDPSRVVNNNSFTQGTPQGNTTGGNYYGDNYASPSYRTNNVGREHFNSVNESGGPSNVINERRVDNNSFTQGGVNPIFGNQGSGSGGSLSGRVRQGNINRLNF